MRFSCKIECDYHLRQDIKCDNEWLIEVTVPDDGTTSHDSGRDVVMRAVVTTGAAAAAEAEEEGVTKGSEQSLIWMASSYDGGGWLYTAES